MPAGQSVQDVSDADVAPAGPSAFGQPEAGGEAAAQVHYWGCNDQVCFIPQTKAVVVPGIVKEVPYIGKTGTESK